MPCVKTMGRNTHTVVSVEAKIAPATCVAPRTAAWAARMPSARRRKMFSMTTMLLSTSMPMPSASPASEITLMVTPEKYISTTANSTLSGMLTAVMRVGRMFRRNRKRMAMARMPPSKRLLSTESMTMLM